MGDVVKLVFLTTTHALIPFTISNNLLQQTCGLNYFNMSETNEVRPESSEEIKEEKQEIQRKKWKLLKKNLKRKHKKLQRKKWKLLKKNLKINVPTSLQPKKWLLTMTPSQECG